MIVNVDVHLATQLITERRSIVTRLNDNDLPGSSDGEQFASSSELTQSTQRRETSTQQVTQHAVLTDTQPPTSTPALQLTAETLGQIVQPIRDQVVGVGETAMFECRLRHHSSSCDVTWLVFPVHNNKSDEL